MTEKMTLAELRKEAEKMRAKSKHPEYWLGVFDTLKAVDKAEEAQRKRVMTLVEDALKQVEHTIQHFKKEDKRATPLAVLSCLESNLSLVKQDLEGIAEIEGSKAESKKA